MVPRPLRLLCGQSLRTSLGWLIPFLRVPPLWLSFAPKTNRDTSHRITFRQSVAFRVALICHYCRPNRRCFGVKRSSQKGCLDCIIVSTRPLKMFCGITGTPTFDYIMEGITVGCKIACRTIFWYSRFVVSLVAPSPLRHRYCLMSRSTSLKHVLTAFSEDWPCENTLRVQTCGFHTNLQLSLKLT